MSTVGPSPDPLYQVFEEYLHSGLYDVQPNEIFVRDIVDTYVVKLRTIGHVPQSQTENLRTDLSQDVLEMLKMKIYGHLTIAAYNRARTATAKR